MWAVSLCTSTGTPSSIILQRDAKKCERVKKKNKREARSSNTHFSLNKTKFKEIKWYTKLLDFSDKAGSGRVEVVHHHQLVALSETVLGIAGYLQELYISRSNSHPSCLFPLQFIRLRSLCLLYFMYLNTDKWNTAESIFALLQIQDTGNVWTRVTCFIGSDGCLFRSRILTHFPAGATQAKFLLYVLTLTL